MARTDGFIKTYNAGAAIAPNTMVKFGAVDNVVIPAATATDDIIGVTVDGVAAAINQRVDVVLSCGVANVKLAGTIARGKGVTSDASGLGVIAATGNRILGYADISGVAGDIIPVIVNVGTL
jgi:hypothetical protein